ncbi:MAG TPA: glycosyltransferase family A protein [Gemmatimonadaceae bacterium]
MIVPTFNRLSLLRETMASVLEQTFGDLELIVVDDGSTDGTAEHVRAMTDARVRLVALSHGGNVSRALNAGVAASRARWLCVLGSDDVWLPTKLERQMRETTAAGARWSYTRYELMTADGAPTPFRSGGSAAVSGWIARPLLSDDLGVTICAVMMERSLVDEAGGFREQFPFRQDFDLVVRIALRAPAHAVDESLVRAREHTGRRTTVTRPEEVQLHNAAVFRALAAEVGDPELRRIARRKEAGLLMAAGKGLLRRGKALRAMRCFMSVRLNRTLRGQSPGSDPRL